MAAGTGFLALSAIYLAGMIWVWAGVFAASGFDHADLFVMFMLSAVPCFVAAWLILRQAAWRLTLPDLAIPDGAVAGLLAAAVFASLCQFIVLGQVPLVKAAGSSDYLEIARIRQAINYGSPVFNYLSPLLVKVIYPVLAIAFFKRGRTWLAVAALLLGMAFGASLMQKSYPLYVAVPVAIYLTISRRFAAAAGVFAVACLIVIAMAVIANPPGPAKLDEGQAVQALPVRKAIGTGLIHRILLTPGETVAQWFEAFPAVYPFEHGCGYRFAAPLLGCPFVNNSELMYLHMSPAYVAQGLRGGQNAAHFAEEYANFGPPGLALSAFLAAFVILVAALLTAGLGIEVVLALNLPFVLTLTSSALHTTLLSGGWAAAIALGLILLGPGLPRRQSSA